MATIENTNGIIGDLIEINNDRVAGFEKVIENINVIFHPLDLLLSLKGNLPFDFCESHSRYSLAGN